MIYLQISVFFLMCLLERGDNSLLSRFKNTNEYVAREQDYKDLLPEEVDAEMLRELAHEVPEILLLANTSVASVYLPPPYHPFDQQPEYTETTPNPRRQPFLTRWVTNNTYKDANARKGWFDKITGGIEQFFDPWLKGVYLTSCYYCGFETERIPRSTICYNAFQSPDWRYRTLKRYYRVSCYRNPVVSGFRTVNHVVDRGYKRMYHRQWMVMGCMKRHLDIGLVYTVRGCRMWTPAWSKMYADHRWRRLEYLLQNETDACIFSPHASLTPFARGISLYARYHVCVCSKRYCNRADLRSTASLIMILLFLYVNIFIIS